jgi:alpha-tubulin suppressor-like RCC1 family protein
VRWKSLAVHTAVAALLVATGCEDPITPGAGTPTLDDPIAGSVAAVSVGGEHSCAITTSGDAYCWGSNEFGQLGVAIGTHNCARLDRHVPCEALPQLVAGGLKFQKIAAGGAHTCGLLTDGRIFCWGDNSQGQIGDPAVPFAVAPRAVVTASLFSDVVAGDSHACGLRTDGVAACWGANDMGQLGVGNGGIGSATPVNANTNQRFASISAGAKRTCARTSTGIPFCWGSHWVARSINGIEVTRSQSTPVQTFLSPAFRQVSVGGEVTCGLTLNGAAYCWEANPNGAMGDGSRVGSTSPVLVDAPLRFSSISAGSVETCAVADTGEPYCWGLGESGQLGVSRTTLTGRCNGLPCALSPNRTHGWRGYSSIAAGVGQHACGLTLGGSVYCWGAGSMGQRGDGTEGTQWSATRVPLP